MKLSILDQSPIRDGGTPREAVEATLELARNADRLGYTRYWLAEHHSAGSLADASPEILVGAVAAATQKIRVGSGGVMLSHYSPLKVAETFRMLEALYPGRIDMGLGRAPGSDQITVYALQTGPQGNALEQYPQQVYDLMRYLSETFPDEHPFRAIRAMPAADTYAAPWLLSSSMGSVRIAAELGMPLSFAHFITQEGSGMVRWYRENFKPSRWFDEPSVNIGVSALAAESTERAREIGMSRHLMRLRRNQGAERKGVPSIDEANNTDYSAQERAFIAEQQQKAIEGDPHHVKGRLEDLAAEYEVDEIIVLTITHDYADRIRSYELLAEVFDLSGEGR